MLNSAWSGTVVSLTLLVNVICINTFGQSAAKNDDIENRIALHHDGVWLSSFTNGSTVQWECIDESLTGKCIEYHNDQWYSFNSGNQNELYLNIKDQSCRDQFGVQIVIIKGTPCQTETYQIIDCVSLENLDDIFIKMEDLEPNTEYLVNVDGYLEDYCEFKISLNKSPFGRPVNLFGEEIELSYQVQPKKLTLIWNSSSVQKVELLEYFIYRQKRGEKKSVLIRQILHEQNTFGESKYQYEMTDSVSESGIYNYRIVANTSQGNRLFLAEETIKLNSQPPPVVNSNLVIHLGYKQKTPLTILVKDRIKQKILFSEDFKISSTPQIKSYSVRRYINEGIHLFEVVVIDRKTKIRETFYFDR